MIGIINAVVNGRDMWETYMQGFESCIKDAKAMHVMCSYNSLNGVPTCANGGLLNSILRDTWKWMVLSSLTMMHGQIYF